MPTQEETVCESYRSYGEEEGMMFELTKHKAYELLKTTWSRVSLDYVILSVGKEYEGLCLRTSLR